MLWKVGAALYGTSAGETWFVIASSAADAIRKVQKRIADGKEYYKGWKIVGCELIAKAVLR